MANKKQFKGYKGKTSAKIIAGVTVSGVLVASIIGGSLISRLNKQHEYDPEKETGIIDMLPEDENIQQDPNYTPDTGDSNVGNIPEPDKNEDKIEMGVEFVEVLAKLTNKSKDYIATTTGTTPNLTITGLSSMTVNPNSGEIVILGQFSMGDKFNNFVASMTNMDTNLEVYNLSSESITEAEFVSALDELLTAEDTTFKLQLKQHIKLSNENEVIMSMLNTRLNELTALNSTDQSVIDEIDHINALLQDTSKAKLSLLLNNRVTSETGGYDYSFSVAVNTGKYVYSSDHVINSKRMLTTSALKLSIEDYLDTVTDYKVNSITSSAVNQALYVINDTAFKLDDTATLVQ